MEKTKKTKNWFSNNLIQILAVITLLTAVFIIIKPSFSTKFEGGISPVPCGESTETSNTKPQSHVFTYSADYYYSSNNWYYTPFTLQQKKKSISGKDCYKVSDILALNSSIKLSDSIAMLTLLVTVFAIGIPLISYLSLKREKEEIEIYLHQQVKEIKEDTHKPIMDLALISSAMEILKIEYIKNIPSTENRSTAEEAAADIAAKLYTLFDPHISSSSVFQTLLSYYNEDIVAQGGRHIDALKKILQLMEKYKLFDDITGRRRLEYNKFIAKVFEQ